jgi:replicative DNA helicase
MTTQTNTRQKDSSSTTTGTYTNRPEIFTDGGPHLFDKEAEIGLIGLAFDPDSFQQLETAGVTPDWFTTDGGRYLYGIYQKIMGQSGITALSEVAVISAITQTFPQSEASVLVQSFKRALSMDVLPSYLPVYQRRLLAAYQRRLAATAFTKAAALAMDRTADAEAANLYAEQQVSEIRRVGTPIELLASAELVEQATAYFKERLEKVDQVQDLIPFELTGLRDFCDGGIRRQEVTLVSAPPKVGKTALMQRQARFHADQGLVVVYFSLEMPRMRWIGRVIQQETGISANKLERGQFKIWENKVFKEITNLKGTSLYLVDDPTTTTESIKRALEHIRRIEGHIDVVYLDYTQLLRDSLGDAHQTAIHVAGQLASIPKKFNCHLFAISNLNRDGNLYGTVFLEYGCDNWWIVKNDRATTDDEKIDKTGEAKIEIKYQRYGDSGVTVPVYWNASYCRFTDAGKPLTKMEFNREY